MSINHIGLHRKNKIPILDSKSFRRSRTSKSMFDAQMKKGFESDCSLESVDLDHNISETEVNIEQNKCDTESSINNLSCNIIPDTNDFLTNTTDEKEKESRRLVLASAADENCSDQSSLKAFHINISNTDQQCLSSKRTSLPVNLLNMQTQSSQCHHSSSTEYRGLDLDNSSTSSTHHNSVFDDLLFEIYDRWHYCYKDSLDSDTFTDLTESDAVLSRSEQGRADGDKVRLNVANLMGRDVGQLKQLVSELSHCSVQMSSRLIKQLKSRERHMTSLRDKYDIMTAILHASSLKRREDSKIRFSIEPMPGGDAFNQWKDAMKAIARLPRGIPEEFKKKVWLSLADNYLNGLCIDWEKTKKFAFNERSNPDDSKLGLQIVKDLHRTGCSGFSGRDNDEDRAVLKRVLLAYARWNKHVGYCQGFNILAALILEVVERQEDSALKVMIYLIDRVLPESYFANNLRSLSVDMAVFRHLLRTHLPELSKHLDSLQFVARDEAAGANYEPPLTNVFTMQWFLTVFATCLSKPMVLRVWDCILLEGSEILLRTAIVIWEKLQHRIMDIKSADEFYSVMRVLNQEMLDDKLLDTEDFIKRIFSIAPFPLQHLSELREKFTYNITPFTNMMNANRMTLYARTTLVADEDDDDDLDDRIHCFSALFPGQHSTPRSKEDADLGSADISKLSPGAYTAHPELVHHLVGAPVLSERVNLDVDMLRRQYKNLMQRQKQAHIILSAVQNKKITNDPLKSQSTLLKGFSNQNSVDVVPPAINHLFASKELLLMTTKNKKNQTVLPVTKRLTGDMKSNKQTTNITACKSLLQTHVYAKYRSCSIESSTSITQSDDKSAGVELSSSLSSSMSLSRDDRSLKSDVTCEPSQPWTESSPRDDDRSCETLHIPLSEIHSLNDDLPSLQIAVVNDQKQTDDTNIDSTDFEASENNENGQSKVKEENILFKEFIDSLPDESGAASKSSRYNKLQCYVENLKPIHHNLRIHRISNSSAAVGTPTDYADSPSLDRPLQWFNPFPRKSFNSSRTRFGVQLGLYLSQNYNKLGTSSADDDELRGDGPHSDGPISKSYHNACLHRQFLVTSTKRPKQAVK